MLADSLNRAFATADGFLADARTKAATLPAMIASGSSYTNQPLSLSDASELYAHNKGWVYACVRLIAQRVAGQSVFVARESLRSTRGMYGTKAIRESLPLQFKAKANRLEPLPQHPLLDVLNDPSELATYWSLMFVTVASLELTGRALWHVLDNPTSGKREIYHIPTHWIRDIDLANRTWKIQPARSARSWDLPFDLCAHFFYPDPADPTSVLSPLRQIAAAVIADEAIAEAQLRTFKQGQMPGLIIKAGSLPGTPGSPNGQRPHFTTAQRNQLVTAIQQAHSGVHRFGEPVILDGLIEDVWKLSYTPAELDFLNSSKVSKARILQGYGMSPILLGEVEGANRASATVADEIFCSSKVNPLISLMSQVMTEWLGPAFAAGPSDKLTIWIDQAVPNDPELLLKKWDAARRNGDVSGNEYRAAVLNLEARPGLDEYGPPSRAAQAAATATPPGTPPPAAPPAGEKSAIIDPYTMRPFDGSAR